MRRHRTEQGRVEYLTTKNEKETVSTDGKKEKEKKEKPQKSSREKKRKKERDVGCDNTCTALKKSVDGFSFKQSTILSFIFSKTLARSWFATPSAACCSIAAT
jgi:hypothetical protein